jgi:hypothetical protein
MAYILNNDRQEDFECVLSLEGASLDDSSARILLEVNDTIIMFKGIINEGGKCQVPIKNLRRIFPSEVTGKMKLEVIAEDTYFSPWEDDVTIKPSKSITVETVQLRKEPEKPRMKIQEIKQRKVLPNINELCESLKRQGFTKKVIEENRAKAIPILGKVIQEYYKSLDAKPEKGITKQILAKL